MEQVERDKLDMIKRIAWKLKKLLENPGTDKYFNYSSVSGPLPHYTHIRYSLTKLSVRSPFTAAFIAFTLSFLEHQLFKV